MSSAHLSPDTLWEAARSELVGDDYAHLQLCPDCREQLESIKMAQGLLVEPPPPPALSDVSARRIGDVLRKAAEKQARSTLWWGAWWPFNWNPMWTLAPLAAALLAFVAYRVTEGIAPSQQPEIAVAKKDAPVPEAPTPPPMPEAPRPLPVKKVVASVKRTKGAKSGDAIIKKAQQLSEGNTVATAKGGELLMALPDGSQIALASASQVQLKKLEDKAITLDVDKGSLKVVAPHDPTRELRVRAGDLEVFDVGTEFIVSRDDDHTLVAVEEGEVEVKAPNGSAVPLKAGQAVEWKGGKLERQQWATAEDLPKPRPRPRPLPVVAAKKPAVEETPDIPSEPQKAAPPAAPAPAEEAQPVAAPEPIAVAETASSPDEWASPENLKDAPTHQPPPVPPPEPPPTTALAVPQPPPPPETMPAGPGPASDDEAEVSFMSKIQSRIDKIRGVFKPPSRLQRANEISTLVERQQCERAIALADSWLTEPVPKGEGFNPRRSVLSSKVRCLSFLGRSGDAAAAQRELEKL